MITFFLIMVLSVLMFHTGLMIFTGYSTVHREKLEKYNWSDLMVLSALAPEDKEKVEEIIATADYVESYEKYYPVSKTFTIERGDAAEGDSKNAYDLSSQLLYVLPYDEWGEIEIPHFTELSDEEFDNPIYISIYINTNIFHAKIGDSIDLKVDDKYYTFQVAGFFEGILSNGVGITYVKPELYDEWKAEKEQKQMKAQESKGEDAEEPQYTLTLFYTKITPGMNSTEAAGLLTRSIEEHNVLAVGQGVDEFIGMLSMMQNMIAAILLAFALVVAIISMIIIYFRITNSIEQNIVNIGALKALGYTSGQIRKAMVLEFALTSSIALAAGVGLSYLILPTFENMMRSSSAVVWEITFNPIIFIITAILIVGTVIVVSTISTKNIKKLDPVIALRFGINDHSFKKNRAPIEKTPGPLTWVMALKSLIGNTKQNIILFVVTFSIGAVTTFSTFLAYNCVYDPMHLYRMLKLEASDVELYMSKENLDDFKELQSLPEVDEIWWTDSFNANVEGYSVYATVTDDWNDIPDVNILEGRCPIYDNEIAIGGMLADILQVKIGDEVTVANGKIEKRYIITGLEQSTDQMGKDITMTTDGARHLGYNVQRSKYSINVKDHELGNTQSVVRKSEDMFGNRMTRYLNIVEALKSGNEQTIIIAAGMVLMMVLISVLVIVLSMNLLVKTLIIKKQKEIGIKKALGFSSNQLRTELVLSMLPQIAIGSAAGSVLGLIGSNPTLASMLSVVGILKSNMDVYSWMGVVAVMFAVVVSFAIIWIISGRIKKISAYSLITE